MVALAHDFKIIKGMKQTTASAQWVLMRPQTQGQAKHDFPVSGSCVRKLSSLTSRRLGAHDIMLCGLANVWRGPDGMGVRVTSIVLVTNTRQSQFSTLDNY